MLNTIFEVAVICLQLLVTQTILFKMIYKTISGFTLLNVLTLTETTIRLEQLHSIAKRHYKKELPDQAFILIKS